MKQRMTSEWRRHPAGRVRLLIEDPQAVWFSDFTRFRAAGFEVSVCTGPDAHRGGEHCPMVSGIDCPLVADADVVLCGLDVSREPGSTVLEGIREKHPGTPVVVEVPVELIGQIELPEGCKELPFPSSVDGQITAIRHALS